MTRFHIDIFLHMLQVTYSLLILINLLIWFTLICPVDGSSMSAPSPGSWSVTGVSFSKILKLSSQLHWCASVKTAPHFHLHVRLLKLLIPPRGIEMMLLTQIRSFKTKGKGGQSADLILCLLVVFVFAVSPVFSYKQLSLIGNIFNGNAFEVKLWKQVLFTCMSHAVEGTFEIH